jgi:DNA-binding NarL/FixJ family response regulator
MENLICETGKAYVLIIDPRPIVRYGIKAMLEKVDNFEFEYGAVKDYREAEVKMRNYHFKVIIFSDFQLGEKAALQVERLMSIDPDIRFVGLTDDPDHLILSQMIDLGVNGYVRTDVRAEDLYQSVKSAVDGKHYYCATIANRLVEEARLKYVYRKRKPEKVSRRELQVLVWISRGKSTKEISTQMKLSPRTVETHRKNLLEKFDAKNVAELIMIGHDYELLPKGGTRVN